MFFGTKSRYTILSNYVTIFKMDAEMSEIFTDFSREKSQKNSAHWLQWVRNYWYLHFSPKLVMFLQGVQAIVRSCLSYSEASETNLEVYWDTDCYFLMSEILFFFTRIRSQLSWKVNYNKKVLLREHKRHTARRVVSTPSVVLTG